MRSEVFKMFKYPSMIKAASFCAAVFALLAVIFKNSIVLIPEVSEVRLCNAVAISFGIWFGPAGAWGCAVGNLIGDLDGSLTWLTYFGFAANFLSAWLPYKAWGVMNDYFSEDSFNRPGLRSSSGWKKIVVCIVLSVVSCCSLLCISFDLYPVMPAANAFCMTATNNITASLIGILILWAMSLIPENILPYWRNMMTEEKSMDFQKKDMKIIRIMTTGAIVYSLIIAVYMIYNKLSFSTMDDYSNPFILGISIACTIFMVVLGNMCRLKPSRVELTL